MFELGVAFALGLDVVPIRDTSLESDRAAFDKFGLLETIGYLDFHNSAQLADLLLERIAVVRPNASPKIPLNRQASLYFMKDPHDTEGSIKIMSALKKTWINFRVFDALETPRLSLHEAMRQVGGSISVIGHLLNPDRAGARVHNGQCAFVAGLALALQKNVALFQDGTLRQPIDYRDLVISYGRVDTLPRLLEPVVRSQIERLQRASGQTAVEDQGVLERLDLGDVAAENEIQSLPSYFVATAQFHEARRGYARLLTGRKGSGKTAIFYLLRHKLVGPNSVFVLDIKPEGHQFTRLKESVLARFSAGLQDHTLMAFWNYMLLGELARRILDEEERLAYRDPDRLARYLAIAGLVERIGAYSDGDFSERLIKEVDRIVREIDRLDREPTSEQITKMFFSDSIAQLSEAVTQYLSEKSEVWLLLDNLDKGWPVRGTTAPDVAILRALLDATRKMQRQFQKVGSNLKSLIFVRNDIYEHLVVETPDKGKDTAITLDWDDEEVFKEILRKRLDANGEVYGSFDRVWNAVAEPLVSGQHSFQYIVDRTLMRPRDMLSFVRKAVDIAINRGHARISSDDILKAEEKYSEDMLLSIGFELSDIARRYEDLLYQFIGCRVVLAKSQVMKLLGSKGYEERDVQDSLHHLVWFGFLGVSEADPEEAKFAHQVRYNMAKLLAPVNQGKGNYVVHKAFRKALGCESR